MLYAIKVALTSIIGARTKIRMVIMKAPCAWLTSVVKRVTNDAVLNLSIFENEKSCTL
ncbi:hypothetical protein SDC9_125899 [bioreactor metagenome]|uniref:Uncharacterized protein n=1 Tax=bioreactor metagenome TaxID=1076179 RepID=A0A645CPT2_9ZZZZ